jgi:hypothetical protein
VLLLPAASLSAASLCIIIIIIITARAATRRAHIAQRLGPAAAVPRHGGKC